MARLVDAYCSEGPAPGIAAQRVAFGTPGGPPGEDVPGPIEAAANGHLDRALQGLRRRLHAQAPRAAEEATP